MSATFGFFDAFTLLWLFLVSSHFCASFYKGHSKQATMSLEQKQNYYGSPSNEKPLKPQQVDYALRYEGSRDQQYPQAEPMAYNDPNAGPVEGQPLYPPPTSGNVNPHLRRFVSKGWKDVWAGALFLIVFITTFVWGAVNMITYKADIEYGDSSTITTHSTAVLVIILASVFVVSICAAMVGMMLMTCFPRQIIYVANVASIILELVTAILAFVFISFWMCLVLIILVILHVVWFYFARRRIPFAAAVLRAATRVLSKYKAIFVYKVLMVLILFVYTTFWSYVLVRPLNHGAKDDEEFTGFDGFTVCFFVFVYFWVMQVLPNVLFVTTAGVTATWYFVGWENMPENPTWKSFCRATTTSFGSICFGSLIVAIIQFMRWLVESSRRDGDGGFLTCCLACLLSCLESIVRYFNTYAYVHIAIYGYDYITAGKHTFELFKQCLFTALFNDCLINPTLNMLAFAVSGVLGVLYGVVCWSVSIGILSFLVAVVVHSLIFTAISSATVTIFVCFAEVPEALKAHDRELYDAFYAADEGQTSNNATP